MSSAQSLRIEVAGAAARFRSLLVAPSVTQEQRLLDILKRNASSEYGRRHGFATIKCAAEYRARVPIVDYADLRTAIERIASGETGVLTSEPVIAFEETGGSTAGPKLIPYTSAGLVDFQRGLLPWLDDLFTGWPGIAAGQSYWAISPACRASRTTAGGIPIGLPSDAAYFGASLARHVLGWLAVNPAVGTIADPGEWKRCTALALLACEDLALISVWSPTFLLELLRAMREEREWLVQSLARGEPVTPLSVAEARPALRPSPARADLVRTVLGMSAPTWEALWARLALISCWDHAAASCWATRLREQFPGVDVQGKGLLATEGMITLPLQGAAVPVLALESGYFEFVDASGHARDCEELEPGAEYVVVMTTASGLYRYDIGDRVRVEGFVERTPALQFLGRDRSVSDLCGEKLTEPFVIGALHAASSAFAVLAPSGAPQPGYYLLLDAHEVDSQRCAAVAQAVEQALDANPQYQYARRIGQLAPLRAVRLQRPLARWIEHGLRRGQRLGDIKPPALWSEGDWRVVFGSETP